jgi:hypothetical protein
MADATPEQVLAAAGGYNGRASLARREILRLMRSSLPGVISLVNQLEPDAELVAPRDYIPARIPNENEKYPVLMVGLATGRTPQSPGKMNFRTLSVMIYYITQATDVESQLDALWDVAELIEATMTKVQGFHCLPDGRKVWTQALWQSTSQVSEAWPAYSGAVLEYHVEQWGLNLWAPANQALPAGG